jgi:hypothetical protein
MPPLERLKVPDRNASDHSLPVLRTFHLEEADLRIIEREAVQDKRVVRRQEDLAFVTNDLRRKRVRELARRCRIQRLVEVIDREDPWRLRTRSRDRRVIA